MASPGAWGYTRCVLADVHTLLMYIHMLPACPSLHLKMQQETLRLAVDESHHPVRHSSPSRSHVDIAQE